MGKLENKAELFLDDKVCRAGGDTYKFVSPGRRNVPDRIVILHSKVWFVEVKAPGESISPGQEREINKMKKNGLNVCWVSGLVGVKDFLNREFGLIFK